MSCQVANKKTLDVVLSYLRSEGLPADRCLQLGADMYEDNLMAYSYRYGLDRHGVDVEMYALDYEYDLSLTDLELPQVYGCINYLKYQISDHRTADLLPTMALLEKLNNQLLDDMDVTKSQAPNLPGYVWGM